MKTNSERTRYKPAPECSSRAWRYPAFLPALLCVAFAPLVQAQATLAPTSRTLKQPIVTQVGTRPQVTRITSIGNDACRRTSTIVFERGVTPSPQGVPTAEMLGGLSGLRLVGPLMHKLDRVELVIGTRRQVVRIFDPIGPGGTCGAIYGTGNGGLSVELPLPEVNQVTQGKLRLFGFEESALAATPKLQCFDAKKRPIACPSGPAPTPKLMQEVDLRIVPRPVLQRLDPVRFSQRDPRVGGQLTFTGTNLDAGALVDLNRTVAQQLDVSMAPTQRVVNVFADLPQPGSTVRARFTTVVRLMRGSQQTPLVTWDTSLTQGASPPAFPTLDLTFIRHGNNSTVPPRGTVGVGGDAAPNLLPVRLFGERPLIRRIGGIGENVMVSPGFCVGLANNQAGAGTVPSLVWGVSSANAPSPNVRTELRDARTNALLSGFESGPLNANDAGVTRENYDGRPAQLRVIRVTGGATMAEYGNQTGCFLDKSAPAPRMDPDSFLLVVDTRNDVDEGQGENDNELRF